jgi:hypothetical protein
MILIILRNETIIYNKGNTLALFKSPPSDTDQRCWKSFRAGTFYCITQMAPKVLQRLIYFPHFNSIDIRDRILKLWKHL